MPKEHIYTVGQSEQYEVQVGWAAERDVQVGVELHDAREEHPDYAGLPDRRSLLWQLFGDIENLRRFGAAMSHYIVESGNARELSASAIEAKTSDEWHEICEKLAIEVLMKLQDDWKPTGIWATLTREDCNQLIKVLRRARDSAFGRDE